MSDRISGFVVTLKDNVRLEEADELIRLIRLLKGVLDVHPNVAEWDSSLDEQRGKTKFKTKLMEFIREDYLEDHPEMRKEK